LLEMLRLTQYTTSVSTQLRQTANQVYDGWIRGGTMVVPSQMVHHQPPDLSDKEENMKVLLSLALLVAAIAGAGRLAAQTPANLAAMVDGSPGALFSVSFLVPATAQRPFLINGPAGGGGIEGRLRALHAAMVALGGVGPVDAGTAGQPVIWDNADTNGGLSWNYNSFNDYVVIYTGSNLGAAGTDAGIIIAFGRDGCSGYAAGGHGAGVVPGQSDAGGAASVRNGGTNGAHHRAYGGDAINGAAGGSSHSGGGVGLYWAEAGNSDGGSGGSARAQTKIGQGRAIGGSTTGNGTGGNATADGSVTTFLAIFAAASAVAGNTVTGTGGTATATCGGASTATAQGGHANAHLAPGSTTGTGGNATANAMAAGGTATATGGRGIIGGIATTNSNLPTTATGGAWIDSGGGVTGTGGDAFATSQTGTATGIGGSGFVGTLGVGGTGTATGSAGNVVIVGPTGGTGGTAVSP
jgi:hypothetical protein